MEAQTGFAFQSQLFNTTETKEYFNNPECYGDDVARWLIAELRKRGYSTGDEPGQEDFGWYLEFTVDGVAHMAVVGHRAGSDGEPGDWLIWLERATGMLGALFGKRRRVEPAAVAAVHEVLAGCPDIRALRMGDERTL